MVTKYEQINEEITSILDKHITREKKHAFITFELVDKYVQFLGCSPNKVKLVLLDHQLNHRQDFTPELQQELLSPLVKMDDGFWYFGLNVEYGNRESKPTGNYVWGTESMVIGLKIINEHDYQVKLTHNYTQTISTPDDLEDLFEKLYSGIVERVTAMFREQNKKKIGF